MRWVALLFVAAACDAPKSSSTDKVAPTASVAPSTSASAIAIVSAMPSATPLYAPVTTIDELVARLAASPMWENGGFSKIDLPEKAPVAKIVDRALALIASDHKSTPRHRILETRTVRIGDGSPDYIACRVETDAGRKIVLLRWMDATTGWWSRVWDAV